MKYFIIQLISLPIFNYQKANDKEIQEKEKENKKEENIQKNEIIEKTKKIIQLKKIKIKWN